MDCVTANLDQVWWSQLSLNKWWLFTNFYTWAEEETIAK